VSRASICRGAASNWRRALQAASANDAVWRIARAAVRAVSELTNSPLEHELRHDPE
jgi:hypothetical protein